MTAPVEETDLVAYVDGQLDLARRIEVEAWLAANPVAAARVMTDLSLRDTLQFEFARVGAAPSAPAFDGARRLGRGLRWRAVMLRVRRAAAILLLLGAGWASHAWLGVTGAGPVAAAPALPLYADEAIDAHRTTLLRDEAGLPALPADEARAAAALVGIALPTLPAGWSLAAIEIVPWDDGSGLEAIMIASGFGAATLFAATMPSFAVTSPTVAEAGGVAVAYWQFGHQVYALCAEAPAPSVLAAAEGLAATLW
jgi:anti-sigma factor RsiW